MSWKTPVTMVGLVLLLVLGTMIGWYYATQDVPSLRDAATADEPKTTCRTYDSGQALEVSAVTVNVFNTGDEPDLAGATMSLFITRGFGGGVAENSERKVPGERVLITAEDPTSAQVRLVRKQLKGGVIHTRASDETDTDGVVNVYLGQRFRGLSDRAPTEVKVQGTTRVCFQTDE